MLDNLDDIVGMEPVAEEMEEKAPIEKEEAQETKEKPKAESTKEPDPEKEVLVKHAAFHEERERRKELQKQVANQEEAYKRLEERQTKILEALAAKSVPQEEQQYIDPISRLENEVREVKENFTKSTQQAQDGNAALEKEQQLVNKYKASIEAFSKDEPDFLKAREYLIGDKVKELKALDYSDQEISQEIKLIETQIVERAYNKGINPAELIAKLAKEKGYKLQKVEKTIDDIDKGLKASKSLGTGGSVSNDNELSKLSAEDLRDMSDEEFNAMFSKLEKQSKRR